MAEDELTREVVIAVAGAFPINPAKTQATLARGGG
jgi:hypothetical protein